MARVDLARDDLRALAHGTLGDNSHLYVSQKRHVDANGAVADEI